MSDDFVISVVLEGNVDSMSKSMDNAAASQRNVKRATDSTNLSFLTQLATYQAMTAALNQTVGGFNKLAGGLDRLGFKGVAKVIRKFTAVLEIIAGPAEIYLAYLTLTVVMGKKDVAVKGAQIGMTTKLTNATKALNAAMLKNPMFLMVVALSSLVIGLNEVQLKFGTLGNAIKAATAPLAVFVKLFQVLDELLNEIGDAFGGFTEGLDNFSDKFHLGKSGGN